MYPTMQLGDKGDNSRILMGVMLVPHSVRPERRFLQTKEAPRYRHGAAKGDGGFALGATNTAKSLNRATVGRIGRSDHVCP